MIGSLHIAAFLVTVLVATQLRPVATPADEALIDAAQRNDLAEVVRALDDGANINATSRYERTALLYAARNANFNMVKLLVERGADLKVEDTYYHRNALGSAITDRNVEMVKYLIEKGTPANGDLLALAIDRSDIPLVTALVSRASVSDAVLAAMHVLAVQNKKDDVAVVLKTALDARPKAGSALVALAPAALASYTGTYKQDSNTYFTTSTTETLVVAEKEGRLSATLGPRTYTLFPASQLEFVAPEAPSFSFRFERRGDVIERVFVPRPQRAREDVESPYVRLSATTSAPAAPLISPDDLAVAPRETPRHWPSFRGAGAAGVADGQGAVADWDIVSGRNVRWKTPIPGIAVASPVVWGNRVYISTAISGAGDATFRTGDYGDVTPVNDHSEHSFKLYSLDSKTGRIAWEHEVHKGVPRTTRHTKGSHASSTPVTDGRRVVVLFGTAGILAAYTVDGQLLWKKDLGVLDSGHFFDATVQWGHSSSPIIYGNSVIVQADRQKDSFIAAYDLADGRELWRTSREGEIPTWGTPTIVKGRAGDELITNGTKVRGYDPNTGRQRWTLAPNSEITVATPVAGPDFVYVTGGYPPARPIYAIRAGATGNISLPRGTSSNDSIAWSNDRDGVYIPTPVVYRGLLYTVNNNGIITVFEAESGARVYRARLGIGGSFAASPVAADGKIYAANEDGEVFVIKAGREFVQIAKHDMKEVIMATPAISDGLIFIRTLNHVYGLGER